MFETRKYHLKICENSELMPETRTPPTQKKLLWQRCITPNIAFRLTTRFWQIMGFFTQNHCLILLNSRYALRLYLMLLSFLTQQNHQHTQSQTFAFSKPNDSVINEHINVPRRSMTGILLLFTENPTAGERDSEKFVNPDIKLVSHKYRWSAEHVIFQRNVADRSVGVNKATFPAKSGIRSYGKQNFTQKTSLLCGSISGVTRIMKFTDRDSLWKIHVMG